MSRDRQNEASVIRDGRSANGIKPDTNAKDKMLVTSLVLGQTEKYWQHCEIFPNQ